MIQTNEKCLHCQNDKAITFLGPNNKSYCVPCMRKIYPPYMTLVKFDNLKDTIYNIEVGKFEKIKDISMFNLCGWEIRVKQEFVKAGATLYRFEYEGNVCCARCNDYPWQLSGTKCWSQTCLQFIDKKPEHLRNYPCGGSVYLSWKYDGRCDKDAKDTAIS
jgi:hypothetical protein